MAAKFALFVLLLAVTGLQTSWQISLPSDPTYYAGIVEFPRQLLGTGKEQVRDNLARMLAIIESEETRDLDILVFPEYVLNNMAWKTYVPDPALNIIPCEVPDYDLFLTKLSCAARSRRLYILVNVVEKILCSSQPQERCDPSGINTYNTNVVFDREGRVISRYRKTHLYIYEWYSTNVLAKPELATFSTDFGVTFGHFICFDMLFYEPAQVLLRELNVTDIIYPTYWFSELPFLTAVQLQEGWAYANNVNLLAADASNPSYKNTGSGIYAGRLGRLAAVIHEEPTTKLLRARVPKHTRQGAAYEIPPTVLPAFVPQLETPRFTRLALLRDYNVDSFATKLLPADFTRVISERVCHGAFCCRFDAARTFIGESSAHEAYRYRLAAYSGRRVTHQSGDPADLSVCAVIACTNAELYSCGHIFPEGVRVANKYYFSAIGVSGEFRNEQRRLIMPTSVDAQMMPLPVGMWDMTEEASGNSTQVSITLHAPKADLLTFGIWGNYYSKAPTTHNLDPPKQQLSSSKNAAVGQADRHIAMALIAAAMVALLIL